MGCPAGSRPVGTGSTSLTDSCKQCPQLRSNFMMIPGNNNCSIPCDACPVTIQPLNSMADPVVPIVVPTTEGAGKGKGGGGGTTPSNPANGGGSPTTPNSPATGPTLPPGGSTSHTGGGGAGGGTTAGTTTGGGGGSSSSSSSSSTNTGSSAPQGGGVVVSTGSAALPSQTLLLGLAVAMMIRY